jgi:hypothetical protein
MSQFQGLTRKSSGRLSAGVRPKEGWGHQRDGVRDGDQVCS